MAGARRRGSRDVAAGAPGTWVDAPSLRGLDGWALGRTGFGFLVGEVGQPEGRVPGHTFVTPCWGGDMKRFLRFFVGTRTPSSRHSRRIRLLLTCQPALRASVAARRHPQRGRRFENSRRRASLSGIGGGARRWVERC